MTPDLEKFTFSGTVDIALKVNEATSVIQCNGNEITFISAKVSQAGKELPAIKTNFDESKEVVTFEFAEKLTPGVDASLHVEFTGILNDKMAGFYRSSYTDAKGEKKYLAVSSI